MTNEEDILLCAKEGDDDLYCWLREAGHALLRGDSSTVRSSTRTIHRASKGLQKGGLHFGTTGPARLRTLPRYRLERPLSSGEITTIIELLVILISFDLDAVPPLLTYLLQTAANVGAPRWPSIRAVEEAVAQGDSMQARELAGQTLAWEVKRWRPNLRGEIAGWIARQMENEQGRDTSACPLKRATEGR